MGRVINFKSPTVPTVSYEYVKENKGLWSGNDPQKQNYIYYWIGDVETGEQVKVKSIEVLREIVNTLALKVYELENELNEIKEKERVKVTTDET